MTPSSNAMPVAGTLVALLVVCCVLGCDRSDQNCNREVTMTCPQSCVTDNPNATDKHGASKLLLAVNAKDEGCVRALLEAGADPNARDVARSPLMLAVTELRSAQLVCNRGILRLLLDYSADPNLPDPYTHEMPLNGALERGDIECSRMIKDAGASVSNLDPRGRTVLESAVGGAQISGDIAVIDLVIGWGVDPNVLNDSGANALARAAWIDSPVAIRALLDSGVDPCAGDKRGPERTPLYKARIRRASPETIALLEAATAKCDRSETSE